MVALWRLDGGSLESLLEISWTYHYHRCITGTILGAGFPVLSCFRGYFFGSA